MYGPGTKVAYTNAWLYSTFQAPFGDACRYRGVTVDDPRLRELPSGKFVAVQWSHDPENPKLILAKNVAPIATTKALDIPSWASEKKNR